MPTGTLTVGKLQSMGSIRHRSLPESHKYMYDHGLFGTLFRGLGPDFLYFCIITFEVWAADFFAAGIAMGAN